MKTDTLQQLINARQAKEPVTLITDLETGQSWISAPTDLDEDHGIYPSDLREEARRALSQDKPLIIERGQNTYFLNPFNPPLRLIVVGAVHIAQPLCQMAAISGYAVTLIDPRTAFATDQRFPDVEIITDWPDEAIRNLKPDSRTSVVTLTHDPKLDDPALDAALRSHPFYIGALGSRKTHAARLKRLAALGHEAAALEKISGPVGLDIGSKSPAEIALSILAEMTCVLRKNKLHEEGNAGGENDGA